MEGIDLLKFTQAAEENQAAQMIAANAIDEFVRKLAGCYPEAVVNALPRGLFLRYWQTGDHVEYNLWGPSWRLTDTEKKYEALLSFTGEVRTGVVDEIAGFLVSQAQDLSEAAGKLAEFQPKRG